MPFWSPDGRTVGFSVFDQIRRVALDGGAVVTIDVTALRFADTAAARVLLNAAVTAGPMHIVGCSPVLVRLLFFHGAAEIGGLIVTAGYAIDE